MFHCSRCRTSFNPTVAASVGNCPRCSARDGVSAPLHFRLFEPSAVRAASIEPSSPNPTTIPGPESAGLETA